MDNNINQYQNDDQYRDARVDKALEDHECRLRKLEQSSTEQRIQLSEISKSQVEIKLMISEADRKREEINKKHEEDMDDLSNNLMAKFTDTITSILQETIHTDNVEKLTDKKGFWAIISVLGTVFGAIVTYLLKK